MASKRKPPVALIAGPTASGKSALSLAFAEETGGVIVNADSAQVYLDIPVLSAAPTAADLRRAEHRLYGFLDGSHPSSAADWAELAKREIAEVHSNGKLPIVVGGTGLYIRTLLDGIAPVPPIDPEIRRGVREASVEENCTKLEAHDPEAASRLKPSDKTRIARALEVVLSTGRTLADWQGQCEGGIGDKIELRPLILLPPRDWLYRRCDERFAKMFEAGAIQEVEALLNRDLDSDLPIMRAIGVLEIATFLRTGQFSDGSEVAGAMGQAIDNFFSHLTEEDAMAIAAFLKSIPAVENEPE